MLAHGLLNAGSATSAAVFVLSTAALFVVGDWRSLRQEFVDLVFMAFVGCAVLSSVIRPWADVRESVLFAIALLSYPAGRLFCVDAIDSIFAKTVLSIAAVGGAFTVIALVEGSLDWTGGKPKVFGEFAAAPAQFMTPFVLAVGALLSSEKLRFQWLPTTVAVALFAIFAAAMVRFTFVAAGGAAIALALVSAPQVRRWTFTCIAIMIVAVAIGQASRLPTAAKFTLYAAQSLGFAEAPSMLAPPATPSPAGCAPIDENNSIEIRKALYRDWLQLMPESGGMGIGLDGFAYRSCHPGNEVHNDLLQIVLEFGWPAAGLFALLLFSAVTRLIGARTEEQARFGLFALTFLVLMSMAHGRISRDASLFFFIGYGISSARPSRAVTQREGHAAH